MIYFEKIKRNEPVDSFKFAIIYLDIMSMDMFLAFQYNIVCKYVL